VGSRVMGRVGCHTHSFGKHPVSANVFADKIRHIE
jgi:hypothetical protein